VNEEVSRDMTGEAGGKNPGVDAYLNERSVILFLTFCLFRVVD